MKVKEIKKYEVTLTATEYDNIYNTISLLNEFCSAFDCADCPLDECDCLTNTIEQLDKFLGDGCIRWE